MDIPTTRGAQSSHRLLQLLVRIGGAHPHGLRLRDLGEQTGLTPPTVHRLVACLISEGFVDRVPGSQRLRLGLEAMQIGLAATRDMPLAERFMPAMKRIARQTEDSVFLIMRVGPDALCVHREEGGYPVKVFAIEPGMRRALGLSSVGLGIMANLSNEEIAQIHATRRDDYAAAGVSLALLQRQVQIARRDGFVQQTEHRQAETSGVAVAARVGKSTYAGLSVAAINSRMGPARRLQIAALLKAEVEVVLGKPPNKKDSVQASSP
jgi:DNA-binding IclR family transcriptional regulator